METTTVWYPLKLFSQELQATFSYPLSLHRTYIETTILAEYLPAEVASSREPWYGTPFKYKVITRFLAGGPTSKERLPAARTGSRCPSCRVAWRQLEQAQPHAVPRRAFNGDEYLHAVRARTPNETAWEIRRVASLSAPLRRTSCAGASR